jgi:hypothetical protein
MNLSHLEPLWRIISRARLERLDEPSASPIVHACIIRAIAKAIPYEMRTPGEIKAWLEIEAVQAENGHD